MSSPLRRIALLGLGFVLTFGTPTPAAALEECRLLRMPDIQGSTIVFVYAGDVWKVARSGGVASRLTSHEGMELFPKLSPDGSRVAFTAEYDGNVDAYWMPIEGGEPTRLTWHPAPDHVAEWYPDGSSILLRSTRASAPSRFDRFFRISQAGGLEQPLPLPTAGYASFSPDAKRIVYVSPSYDRRTWKRYRGGNAPELLIYDFAANTSEKITDWAGPDEWPMWYRSTIYYCSDRGGRTANLWAYDIASKQHRAVTQFAEYDVKWPSIGSDALVFENGGTLYSMSLPDEKVTRLKVLVPDDKPATRAEYRDVSEWITGWDLSPSGKRALFEARGELFTVPAERGDARNLTNTSGARERAATWSPDGKWIAYLSDASGEYEVYVMPADGSAPGRRVTAGGDTYRYDLAWSPDSKKLAFSDKTRSLWWCDVASGKRTRVDQEPNGKIQEFTWSGDSRWIAYSAPGPNDLGRVTLYSLASGQRTRISDGMTHDGSPSFDPKGRYLYFVSSRSFIPDFGLFENDFYYPATDKIYAVTLRADLPSPVSPESDEEGAPSDDEDKDDESEAGSSASGRSVPAWRVDLAGIGSRVAEIPVEAGRLSSLRAFENLLLYVDITDPDMESDGENASGELHAYDLEKRKDRLIAPEVSADYAASADGGKVLVQYEEGFGIIGTDEEHDTGDGAIKSEALMASIDPRAEWRQMFEEAWRLERDFYYDPAMGGVDWKAMGERYRQLLPYVAHRSDLNYVLGELIGELGTSHTYVGGGDAPQTKKTAIGLLGADYDLDERSGRYRFRRVYRARDWNAKTGAPLGVPGVDVKDGDLLLAVNGVPVRATQNVHAAFVGTVGRQTRITVGSRPDDPRARTYTVVPIESEVALRYMAWVAANREKVDRETNGRVAYVHLPNTWLGGIQEFTKQYYPQVHKHGLIVDERFNGGGLIPDFLIERIARQTWVYWSTRDGIDLRTPTTGLDGPKVMIANQYAGSGGDALPYYFRLRKIGPVIGKRTWGGLVGISESLPLVDGGMVTMPDFGMWDPRERTWVVENYGVDPDIEVENTPESMVSGHDLQLERAIQWCNEQLRTQPASKPARPAYKVRP